MSRYEDDESKGKNVCVCVCAVADETDRWIDEKWDNDRVSENKSSESVY